MFGQLGNMFGFDVDVVVLYCKFCFLCIGYLVDVYGVVGWCVMYGIGDQIVKGVDQFWFGIVQVGMVVCFDDDGMVVG